MTLGTSKGSRNGAVTAKLAGMRAEAVSWDDLAASNPQPASHDKWHVALAPDEVKIVSLEQLDDLYRLSIVDDETNVWKVGMSEWQPLRVIAGLEEPPPARPKPPAPRSAPPAPPRRQSVGPAPTQTAPRSVAPAPTRPAPRSVGPTLAPAPTYAAPAPRPVAPAPTYAAPAPRPVAPAPRYAAPAPTYTAPLSIAPAPQPSFAPTPAAFGSVRPLVVSHAPVAPARSGGGFGRFLVGLAVLSGAAVTLYRNDVIRDGAHAAHQDALYARLEAALGGPAFGTPRSIEANVPAEQSEGSENAAAASLSVAPRNAVAVAESANVSPAVSTAAATTPPPVTATTPPAVTATTPAATTAHVVSLESLAREKKAPASAQLVAPAPARAVATPMAAAPATKSPTRAKATVERSEPVATKPASQMTERERLLSAIGQAATGPSKGSLKSKASEYDPLNPKL